MRLVKQREPGQALLKEDPPSSVRKRCLAFMARHVFKLQAFGTRNTLKQVWRLRHGKRRVLSECRSREARFETAGTTSLFAFDNRLLQRKSGQLILIVEPLLLTEGRLSCVSGHLLRALFTPCFAVKQALCDPPYSSVSKAKMAVLARTPSVKKPHMVHLQVVLKRH